MNALAVGTSPPVRCLTCVEVYILHQGTKVSPMRYVHKIYVTGRDPCPGRSGGKLQHAICVRRSVEFGDRPHITGDLTQCAFWNQYSLEIQACMRGSAASTDADVDYSSQFSQTVTFTPNQLYQILPFLVLILRMSTRIEYRQTILKYISLGSRQVPPMTVGPATDTQARR